MKISTRRARLAFVFEEAAFFMANGWSSFCCVAIDLACRHHSGIPHTFVIIEAFGTLLAPVKDWNSGEAWWSNSGHKTVEHQERILALLFAAAMARAGAMDSFLKKGGKRA